MIIGLLKEVLSKQRKSSEHGGELKVVVMLAILDTVL